MANVITTKQSREVAHRQYDKYGSYLPPKKGANQKVVVVRHKGKFIKVKIDKPEGEEITKADIARAVDQELRQSGKDRLRAARTRRKKFTRVRKAEQL